MRNDWFDWFITLTIGFASIVVLGVLLAIGLLLVNELEAHPPTSSYWLAPRLVYFKDERTKICYAVAEASSSNYGPYFSMVPCEKLDTADWHYYIRREHGSHGER